MPRRNQMRWVMGIGAVVLVALLGYFTYEQTGKQYEVCMTFRGVMHCATARGSSAEEAIRTAKDVDCANLSNGRDELMVCGDTPPTSVREVK
jgi:hypothetical protein